MKKLLLVFLALSFLISPLLAQPRSESVWEESKETILFTDDAGRSVELHKDLTKVASSGATATMILSTLAPEYMTSISGKPTEEQIKYLPSNLLSLPVVGNFYGGKSTLNVEELLLSGAEVILDIGDYKEGIQEDLDALQTQTGIPCIFLSSSLNSMAKTYRSLGTLLKGKEERSEKLASYIEKTLLMAETTREEIPEEEQLSVLYTSGPDGLGTNAKGSTQAQVLELIGAINAVRVDKVTSKSGGNLINMEQLYAFNPDVILFAEGSIYKEVGEDATWRVLNAVKAGRYYEIPCTPYNWLGNPPSVNMVLGIWWLGNLLYPQYYSYNMEEVAKEFYALFWNYRLTTEEVQMLLAASTGK